MSDDLRNVVLVGLGLAGAPTANALAQTLPSTHRLVCISRTESAYYPVASLRGAVAPNWEEKVTLSLDMFFPRGSRHIVLAGVSVLELGKHHVLVDKAVQHPGLEQSTTIPFDYAILAMGSAYPVPCRPQLGSTRTGEVSANLQALQLAVSASSSILVAGGGPVGIEFCGEVKALFPDKKVTLVHSRQTLMDQFKPSLGETLLRQLKHLGVRTVFEHRLDTAGLETGPIEQRAFDLGPAGSVEADFLFLAFGNSPQTSLLTNLSPSLLNDERRVRVKPTLQVDAEGFEHIFAVGDITDIPETKVWANAQHHGQVVAANIVALIQGNLPSKTYQAGAQLIVISIGPGGGASQLYYGVVVGAWATSLVKSRTLFYSKFKSTYNA